jgi:predicted ABC-type ATPase
MPTLILIAGPNGAGKTTFATEILTTDLKGVRFINADEIARGLSPFDPASVAIKAGRILLSEVAEHIASGTTFALESTLSGKAHAGMLSRAKSAGFQIVLVLRSPSPASVCELRKEAISFHPKISGDAIQEFWRIW